MIMRTFNFDKLAKKSFVNSKRGLRAEFRQVFGIIFVKVTDIITGVVVSDEFASDSDIRFLLERNGL